MNPPTNKKPENGAKKFVSLKVAAESKAEGVQKETSFKLDPFVVEVEPGFNRPISRAHIESIKQSIRSGAELSPIWVRVYRTAEGSRIVLVDGEHRLWAVIELIEDFRAGREGGKDIPLISAKEFKGSDADRIAHLLTSAQGLAIAPLDLGIQYQKLLRLHWTRQQIADRVGKSITHVDQCLMLADSNTDVQQAVRSGAVAGSVAVDLLREHGDDAGKVIQQELEKVQASGKSKVTRASIHGRAIPRKLSERVTDSFGRIAERIALPQPLPELAALPPDTPVQVTLPASVLAEVMAAHEELLKHRAKSGDPAPGLGEE